MKQEICSICSKKEVTFELEEEGIFLCDSCFMEFVRCA